MSDTLRLQKETHVLIIGGGFAGIQCAKSLAGADIKVTLADRHNYHLFQPLLYQVASAVLSPADIAAPIRRIFRHQNNIRVVLAKLQAVDFSKQKAFFPNATVDYDYLVLATGVTHSYFGHDEWAGQAPGLKTLDEALEIRRRILTAYEAAEWEADIESRKAKLTFVVVGGGPTGVELAGALKEIASQTIPKDFRNIDTTTTRIILIEAGTRLLSALPEQLGEKARKDLTQMGVEVRLNSPVTNIQNGLVSIGEEQLPAENVIWAAGVRGSKYAETLGVELDVQGRIKVLKDLSLPGIKNVFAIGDLACVMDQKTGQPVPGVAPAAIQMGRLVAENIKAELTTKKRRTFVYRDKGGMATIGRNRAVASIAGLNFSGFPAWLVWSLVHIIPLVGFRSKFMVIFNWIWNYFSVSKSARLITGRPPMNVKEALPVTPPVKGQDPEE
ncbi:MAG: NAD(P)/FAD-dependent oxidoreductase [Deltaproteobacteria bacterium]|nr:NAD(P)/FAD-dependent oxidoreductase [Deltaproteobacteria bacterium]MCW8893154.1 NAD(P)/FAD-dependent oxidoreductase [Deltaproteobacteria bacterium]MCW9049279.1 NAD(P)/FAD-dependent oxidoreductase [Deltaproteobacteria bacterium]